MMKRLATGPTVTHTDVSYDYQGQTIRFGIWTNSAEPVKTVVFLGSVQIGRIPGWIARACPEGTAVVQGAPHWLAKADGSDTVAFMLRYADEALTAILKIFKHAQLHLIAESQAVPPVLNLLAHKPEYAVCVEKLTLLQPLGLNAAAFADTPAERMRIFKRRVLKNARYQVTSLLLDRRLLYNHVQLFRMVGFDTERSNAQFAAGLSYDASADLCAVGRMPLQTKIICGGRDMVFPDDEIKAMVQHCGAAVSLETVPGVPHSPLATRFGLKLLRAAFV